MRTLIALCLLILMLAAAHAAPVKFGKVASGSSSVATPLFADGFDPAMAACPAGRQEFSSITYGIYPQPNRPWVDLTKWENIWGAASTTPTVMQLWPGPLAASPVFYLGRTSYVAAKFHVPAGFATTKFGQYAHGINPPGPAIDASYSTRCGDFAPQPGTGCVITGWPDDLSTHLAWKASSINPSFCGLKPNTDYYLNVRFTDSHSTWHCDAGQQQCQVYLQHTHN